MAAKSDKEKISKKDISSKTVGVKKSSVKSKKTVEKDDFEDEETTPKAGKKSLLAKNRDEGEEDVADDIIEEDATRNKGGEEDEDWDPDFEEFDLPKSSKKTSVKKGGKDLDDDYKVDDEFKDLFGSNSSSKKYNEDDDY